ncbi:MAG: hypothetical protein NTW74_13370 [Acidobacteria bacterium]|nr:hypothetical protein [Acidobacteriota bacterium]
MISENWMEQIAELCDEEELLAPSCLKSKLYSRLIEAQQLKGPLKSLKETAGLCVFEKLIEILPAEKNIQSFQYCQVCHARVAGERIENAPIYWANCPYCEFQPR